MKIEDLKLNKRTRIILENNCTRTVEQFMSLTEEQVLRIPNSGPATWYHIHSRQKALRHSGGLSALEAIETLVKAQERSVPEVVKRGGMDFIRADIVAQMVDSGTMTYAAFKEEK